MAHSDDERWLQHAAVNYSQLADLYLAGGEGRRALTYYEKSEILERRHAAEPTRADFARDVLVSCDRMARIAGGLQLMAETGLLAPATCYASCATRSECPTSKLRTI